MMKYLSLFVALVLAACTAQGPTLNVQAEQMELALVECKAQLGFGGQLKTDVSFDSGVASARAVAFDQVTPAQASQINACASGAETLSDGLVVVPMTAMAPVAVAPVAVVDVVPTPAPKSGPCPIGYTGMYAGTLYCTGAAP